MDYRKHEIAKRGCIGYGDEGSKDFIFDYLELKSGRSIVLKIQTPDRPFETPFTKEEIPESQFAIYKVQGRSISDILAEHVE